MTETKTEWTGEKMNLITGGVLVTFGRFARDGYFAAAHSEKSRVFKTAGGADRAIAKFAARMSS